MITISTGGIGPMDIVTNTKAKGTSKEEEKAVDAFASLMNMVSARQDMPEATTAQDVDVTEVASTNSQSRDYEKYAKQEQVDTSEDKLQNTDKQVVKEDTETAQTKEVDTNVTEEQDAVDKVAELIKEVKNTLKEALGLTEEEIDGLLADMGIDLSQLLIGDNLKNFILQSQGATNVDLLVNESLAELLSGVTDKISQLVEEFGFVQGVDFEQFLVNNINNIQSIIQNTDDNSRMLIDETAGNEASKLNGVDEQEINNIIDEDIEDYGVEANELKEVKSAGNLNESQIGDGGNYDKITVKLTSSDNGAMTQEQTAEQSSQHIQANFNHALDNAVNASVDVTSFAGEVQEADIIRQIIDQIKVNAGKEIQSMEVQLNPENLGKVYVNVEAKDGVMQAKIIAETEAAKNAIENNLAILKENFSNNEIKVEAIEVMVAAYGFFEEKQNGDFDNQEQAKDASKSVGSIDVKDLNEDELTQEEELEIEIMKTKGNTVSYTV